MQVHSSEHVSPYQRHAAKLIAAGLCIYCRAPHGRGTQRCEECTKTASQRNNRYYRAVREAGLCAECRQPWTGKTRRCAACKAIQRTKWHAKIRPDCCNRCGGLRDGPQKSCSTCRAATQAASKVRRARLDAEGRCVQCGTPRTGSSLFCEKHILRTAARSWLKDASQWQALGELLEKQGRRCAYTGESLILGDNASLDHKIPRSRGGPSTIENFQWVTDRVNWMKGDLTDEEFLARCRVILAYRESNTS